jgi:flagellar basal-body rod modification protein FlgD
MGINMAAIPSILANSSSTFDSATLTNVASKNQLGQDDFLNLLVTKMKEQDPMNPQSDTDFIAQMAQFSSLEQGKSMSADVATLKSQQEVLTANGLIGRNVAVTDSKNNTVQGMVTSVATTDGSPQILIGGNAYSLDSVTSIAPFAPTV